MTENELKAVRFIKSIKNHAMVTLDHIAKEEPNVSPLVYKGREEKADTILAMVEELKQYHTIGTPEECLRNKDFLRFLANSMNQKKYETYLRIYNAVEKDGRDEE